MSTSIINNITDCGCCDNFFTEEGVLGVGGALFAFKLNRGLASETVTIRIVDVAGVEATNSGSANDEITVNYPVGFNTTNYSAYIEHSNNNGCVNRIRHIGLSA